MFQFDYREQFVKGFELMRQKFEELHDMLKTVTAEIYPEVIDFTFRAPRDGFVSLSVVDNPASKTDRILISFLDRDGELLFKGEEPASEMVAYKLYTAHEKMLDNLAETVAEIDADIQNLAITDVDDFRRLKYLKAVFSSYKPFLEVDRAKSRENFECELGRSLGRRIRQMRQSRGITIEEFADRVFVSRVTMNRYELGIRIPSAAKLFQIARVTGVSVDWLLGVDNNETD